MLYPKPKQKKQSRRNEFSAKIKKTEYEDAGGLCRKCRCKPIQHYHHANEKGMGGGRGLSIQINCIGVCWECHNHDSTEFLKWSDKELERRIDKEFSNFDGYSRRRTAQKLDMSNEELTKQLLKGFLKANGYITKDDIKRWLMGKGVVA